MNAPIPNHHLEEIIQRLLPQARLQRACSLQGGYSAGMTALHLELPDGKSEKWVLRQPAGECFEQSARAAEEEYRLLQMLADLNLPAPRPLALDISGEVIRAPYLLIEYIEGEALFSLSDPGGFEVQAADQLAAIHQADMSKHDLSYLRVQIGCPECLDALPGASGWTLETAGIREVLRVSWPQQHSRVVLLHGDYWPGNLLWQTGRLTAVIDWEDARLGDPLYDLAITRLDLLCIFGIEVMHAFTQHYLSQVDCNATALPYWDLCAALRMARLVGQDLGAWAAYYPPLGRKDITVSSLRQHHRHFVRQAFETLGESE